MSEKFDSSEDSLNRLIGRRAKILDVGLDRDSQWAVGRVGKITHLRMFKDLEGLRKLFFAVTLWYRRRGGGLKSEAFYLKRSQIKVLPDRRRQKERRVM